MKARPTTKEDEPKLSIKIGAWIAMLLVYGFVGFLLYGIAKSLLVDPILFGLIYLMVGALLVRLHGK